VPRAVLVVGALLALVDVGLRSWQPLREKAAANASLLAIAWVSFFALPHVGARTVVVAAAVIGVLSMFNFARMVGLSMQGRFFVPALLLTLLCFPLAGLRHGSALAAVPVASLLAIAVAGATAGEPHAFLQKLCLGWLAVLVYGFLYAHAVLYVHGAWPTATANELLALMILAAKFANAAWLVALRATGSERLLLLAAPVGGGAGGALVVALWPGLGIPHLPLIGLGVGLAMGAGTRAHSLIVADVTGEPEGRGKGRMLFGFGLALAVGYWLLALDLGPGWV
jgi:hypothetical protein